MQLGRLPSKVFGDEGDVALDAEFQAMVAASALLVTGTVLVSPLVSDLAHVFDVPEARAGLLIVVYTICAAATIPIAGVLADRFGKRAVIVPGMVVFGVAGAAVGLTSSFEMALAFRGLQAVGFAFAMPSIIAAFGDLYTGTRETTAQGIRVMGNHVPTIVFPTVAGALFVLSWRLPFLIYLLAIPIAFWLWFALPRFETATGSSVWRYVRDLATFVNDASIALLLTSFMVRFVLIYGVLTYVSVLAVRETDLPVVAIGMLVSLFGLFLLLSASQAGRLVTAIDPAIVVLVGFATSGTGVLLMGLLPIPSVLVVGIVLFGLGEGLIAPTHKSLVNRLSPPPYRGGAMSAALTFQNVGKVVGSAGGGLLLGFVGAPGTFLAMGVVCGGLGAILLFGVWLTKADDGGGSTRSSGID